MKVLPTRTTPAMWLRRTFGREAEHELDGFVLEPMEPRLLLSADALGLDAGVLDHDAIAPLPWDLSDAVDWSAATVASPDEDRTEQASGLDAPEPLDTAMLFNEPNETTDDSNCLDALGLAPLYSDADGTNGRREIVFLDPGVADGETLLADLAARDGTRITQVHVLHPEGDGVAQIARVLMGQQDIDTVHIISHGGDGRIQLGGTWLDAASLAGQQHAIQAWGEAFGEEADLLFYGCNLAAGEEGRALVAGLAELTGADVAASDDLTGSKALGGDWDLEYTLGRVEAEMVLSLDAQQAFSGTLAAATFQDGFGGYSDTQDTYIDSDSDETSFGTSDDLTTAEGDDDRQALIRFDNIFGGGAGQVPLNSIINEATLTFDVSGTNGSANISIHRMLSTWSEGSTWDALGNGVQLNDAEAVSAADDVVDGGDSMAVFGVTDSLTQWSLLGATNFGWVLDSDHGSDWKGTSSEKSTASVHPLLKVDYTPVSGALFVTNATDTVNGNPTSIATLQASNGGDGVSLREAILAANGTPGLSVVKFQIGSGVQTIQPDVTGNGALPDITEPIVLDARTQPSYSGTPLIQLDGQFSNAGDDGLNIAAGGVGSTIRGFAIYSFQDHGIFVNAGSDNTIEANYIGTDATGGSFDGNAGGGILISGSSSNVIGGADTAFRNVIVDNDGAAGIEITGAASTANQIFGNYIGLGPDGSAMMGNAADGVLVGSGANGNFIGGVNAGEGNVISANGDDGIEIAGINTDDNRVRGNYIGLNATGDAGRGNTGHGVVISGGASSNTIGGGTAGECNVISANTLSGVVIQDAGTSSNAAQGNYIGTGADGTTDLGNAKKGVLVMLGATNNTLGGTGANDGNLIAYNDELGVRILSNTTTGNAILGNVIHSNTELGIDLYGPNLGSPENNDSKDPDTGPNNLQNFPVLSSALVSSAGDQVTVNGTLDSLPNTTFRIELFKNTNSETHGEAEAYLGTVDVTTDSVTGIANFSPILTATLSGGEYVTATATEMVGATPRSTSELAANVITKFKPAISVLGGSAGYTENAAAVRISPTATVTDPDAANFNGGSLTMTVATNGTANDRLAINDEGAGPTNITVVANEVYYGGLKIGSFSGGNGHLDLLLINFDTNNATGTAVQALVENVTFANVSEMPDINNRTVDFNLVDNDGQAGDSAARTVSVVSLNDDPEITSSATPSVVENQTSVLTVTSTDVDGGAPVYSLTGGADQSQFSINPTTGALKFNTGPDFEAPTDADTDNVYEVEVTADDGNGGTDVQLVSAAVTDVVNDTTPGGVASGITLWLKADAGVTTGAADVSQWDNQVENSTLVDVRQSTSSKRPDLNASELNFNPVITFDGDNDALRNPSVNGTELFTADAASIFAVVRVNSPGVVLQWEQNTNNRVNLEDPTPRFDFGDDEGADTLVGSGMGAEYHIVNVQAVPGSPVTLQIRVDGELDVQSDASSAAPLKPAVGGQFALGEWAGGGVNAAMDLAEVVVYDTDHSAIDRLRIDSYLAVKYGITLDQTTPTDYVDSSSNIIWDATANAGFGNDIAGIGQDDSSALNQSQSRSMDSDSILTASAASNQDDGEFLLWGNDNGTLTEIATGNPAGVDQQLQRIWKVDETGELGDVTLTFDLTSVPVSGMIASDFDLIVDTDTDFSSGATLVSASSYVGGIVSFTGVNLVDGQFFALGTEAANTAPTIGDAMLAAVDEGTVDPPGDTIDSLFSGSFSDLDSGASLAGVAVIGNPENVTEGVWEYSSDGANWFAIGTVADDATALALSAATQVRFVPASDYNGGPGSLTVLPLDNTYGGGFSDTTGGVETRANVDTSSNGDPTAIGDVTATLGTSVNPDNDDPVAIADRFTLAEGSTTKLNLAANDTDADDGLNLASITIVSAPSSGRIDSINADGTVDYTHDGSETLADSFTYRIDDLASATSSTVTVSLTVTPQNDVPTLVNPIPDQGANEDVPFGFQLDAGTFHDADADDDLTYSAQKVDGSTLPAWLSFDAATRTFSGTPANEDVGTIGVEVMATDGSGAIASDIVELTVTNINDAPVLANNTLTLDQGGTVLVTPAMLLASDVDDLCPALQFTVSGLSGGQFELVSDPGVVVTGFTQAQVAAGEVVFVDDGDAVPPAYNVTVSDGITSYGPVAATVTFNATSVVETTDSPPETVSVMSLPPVDEPIAATIVTPIEPADRVSEAQTATDTDDVEAEDEDLVTEDEPVASAAEEGGASLETEVRPDTDSGNPSAVIQPQALLKSLAARQAVLGVMAAPQALAESFEVDVLAAEIRTVLASSAFNEGLDRVRQDLADPTFVYRSMVGSGVAVTTGLSVGYVTWLVRGGVLLSTALSSLPAWQFVDPLPVLARTRHATDADDPDAAQEDSLEGIIKGQPAEAADTAKNAVAENEPTEASAQRS